MRDSGWLKRVLLLFGALFVESGSIEIVLFSRVDGWIIMILEWHFGGESCAAGFWNGILEANPVHGSR